MWSWISPSIFKAHGDSWAIVDVLEVQQENLIIEAEAVYPLPPLEGISSTSHDAMNISVLSQCSNWKLHVDLVCKTRKKSMNSYENANGFDKMIWQKCINQVWKGDPRWWKVWKPFAGNIIWVLPYYISRFVHKDPHALEFSSWGGGWKVFQFPCPCFYPHCMYVCSFRSHNTGHKPFYRSCFQLIDHEQDIKY